MSEINSRRAARGRVSLRGRRARASEGRLFVCFETGRRPDARLWLRGFAGLPVRVPCFEKPRDGADVPLRAPCECVSRRRSYRSRRRCAAASERRDVAAEARPLHGQVRQDARGRARRPRQAPRRRRAEDVAGVRARELVWNRCAPPPRRRRNGVTVLQLAGPLGSVGRVEGGCDAGLLQ